MNHLQMHNEEESSSNRSFDKVYTLPNHIQKVGNRRGYIKCQSIIVDFLHIFPPLMSKKVVLDHSHIYNDKENSSNRSFDEV